MWQQEHTRRKRTMGSGLEKSFYVVLDQHIARPLRIEYPRAIYHITSRGNARERIFLEEALLFSKWPRLKKIDIGKLYLAKDKLAAPQSRIIKMIFSRLFPRSVREYSTFGGTSA